MTRTVCGFSVPPARLQELAGGGGRRSDLSPCLQRSRNLHSCISFCSVLTQLCRAPIRPGQALEDTLRPPWPPVCAHPTRASWKLGPLGDPGGWCGHHLVRGHSQRQRARGHESLRLPQEVTNATPSHASLVGASHVVTLNLKGGRDSDQPGPGAEGSGPHGPRQDGVTPT